MTNTAPNDNRDETRLTIAFNLTKELKRQRWTGRAAATALGLTQPYVSRRMTGAVDLTGSDLTMFADFLEVPVARFFEPRPSHYKAQILQFVPRDRPATRTDNSRPPMRTAS